MFDFETSSLSCCSPAWGGLTRGGLLVPAFAGRVRKPAELCMRYGVDEGWTYCGRAWRGITKFLVRKYNVDPTHVKVTRATNSLLQRACGARQNRRQKVFNSGALHLCRGSWMFVQRGLNAKTLFVYSDSYFHLGRLGALFGRSKPARAPPWQRDWCKGVATFSSGGETTRWSFQISMILQELRSA